MNFYCHVSLPEGNMTGWKTQPWMKDDSPWKNGGCSSHRHVSSHRGGYFFVFVHPNRCRVKHVQVCLYNSLGVAQAPTKKKHRYSSYGGCIPTLFDVKVSFMQGDMCMFINTSCIKNTLQSDLLWKILSCCYQFWVPWLFVNLCTGFYYPKYAKGLISLSK